MALRFLADHCVSNSTVRTLREANHEVLRLKDVVPVDCPASLDDKSGREVFLRWDIPGILNMCADCEPIARCPVDSMPLPSRSTSADLV
jgi:hypothetical protein